jgi:dimethylhistidine N-methyltransferase
LIEALKIDKTRKFELIELGPGDGSKSIHLLRGLLSESYDFQYFPVDISQNALEGLVDTLSKQLPELQVKPQHGDYFEKLKQLYKTTIPKILMVLGSNIGNLRDQQAADFIYHLGENLISGDTILLGVDLIKKKEIVLPAYNDPNGITAAFNLNLLERINRELDADFNLEQFKHTAFYEEEEGIAKSYLQSMIEQTVRVGDNQFHFEKGETIHTEISRKYNDLIMGQILADTDITIHKKIMDSRSYFADYILIRNG